MDPLTGKQKRHLRALGQKLSAVTVIGKAGINDAAVANLSSMLARHELVKVRLGEAGPAQRDELVAQLEQAAGAQCPGQVGRTALLYRRNPDLPAKQRIRLPDVD